MYVIYFMIGYIVFELVRFVGLKYGILYVSLKYGILYVILKYGILYVSLKGFFFLQFVSTACKQTPQIQYKIMKVSTHEKKNTINKLNTHCKRGEKGMRSVR